MTGRTSECIVCPDQSVSFRERGVIKGGSGPGVDAVAILAGRWESGAGVFLVVVRRMTRQTIVLINRIEQRLKTGRRTMASRTRCRIMCSNQCISVSKRSVIKGCAFPGIYSVTILTGRWEACAGMLFVVIRGVTRDAIILIDRIEERLKTW